LGLVSECHGSRPSQRWSDGSSCRRRRDTRSRLKCYASALGSAERPATRCWRGTQGRSRGVGRCRRPLVMCQRWHRRRETDRAQHTMDRRWVADSSQNQRHAIALGKDRHLGPERALHQLRTPTPPPTATPLAAVRVREEAGVRGDRRCFRSRARAAPGCRSAPPPATTRTPSAARRARGPRAAARSAPAAAAASRPRHRRAAPRPAT